VALSSGLNQQECEANHSSPSNAEVNAWSYTSTHPYVFVA